MKKIVLLISIFVAAFLFRILPYWNYVFQDGKIYIADPDACYHLRRIEVSAQHFPHLLILDNFAGAESKNHIIWAPLYDWIGAFLWRFMALLGFGKQTILALFMFISPILAVLNAFLIYKLALLIYNESAFAIISSFFFSILPRGIIYSSLGNLDHHAIEVLCMSFLFYRLILLLKQGSLKSILLFSLSVTFATLVWTGSIFFAFCSLLVAFFYCGNTHYTPLKSIGMAFLFSAFCIAPFSLYYVIKGAPTVDFYAFSFFQPLSYVILSALIFIFLKLIHTETEMLFSKEKILMFFSYAAGIVALFLSFQEVFNGIKYLMRKQPLFMSFVSESESIFKISEQWSLSAIILYFSFFIFLLPLFYILLAARKKFLQPAGYAFLTVIVPVFFILICLQKKFSYHFSVPFSILLGLSLYFCYAWLIQKIKSIAALAIIIIITAGMLYPIRPIFYFANDNLYESLHSLLPVYAWLKQKTPSLQDKFNQKERQDYYILSEWSLGHYIQYYAHRAVIVDNFGKDNQMHLAAQILLTYSEYDALQLLYKHKIKYILVRDYLTTLYHLPLLIGENPKEYFNAVQDLHGQYYISPVGGLTFGFILCEKSELFNDQNYPLYNKIKLIQKWPDTHREKYRDGLKGNILLYEVVNSEQ
ncbi:MAG: hypothetical protein A2Y62_07495 [Candidatus Fischerbacteria bacterium RBG_13_37_8]|uniref:Glycosyltransferase RgtA/B/C/D-like domain-containing protein n=1 Tax=Candidatus Fischerbacteria bacterium RBG_13_37_8 TaxID=1817863 RepID=A0A1F5VI47_9BACT|nr:MAG: hypothetical protein A2Y62_07495 [Candidatus Fischerbacteria bacterium RBG_13_37_8]